MIALMIAVLTQLGDLQKAIPEEVLGLDHLPRHTVIELLQGLGTRDLVASVVGKVVRQFGLVGEYFFGQTVGFVEEQDDGLFTDQRVVPDGLKGKDRKNIERNCNKISILNQKVC